MALKDGSTSEQIMLASEAGKTQAQAYVMSGADLTFARQQRRAGNKTTTTFSGADLEQLESALPNIHAVGKPTSYLAAGGEATRIFGENFTGATAVQFGGTNGTAFSVVSDEIINIT